MTKLIERYLANPSLKNAKAIRAYKAKHPFAMTVLSALEAGLVQGAILQANQV
jgi:hypothetical protein